MEVSQTPQKLFVVKVEDEIIASTLTTDYDEAVNNADQINGQVLNYELS